MLPVPSTGGARLLRRAGTALMVVAVAAVAFQGPAQALFDQGPANDGEPVTVDRVVTREAPDEPATRILEGDEQKTASQEISCGGVSPVQNRCTRQMVLRSHVLRWRITAEPVFRGTIHLRVSSDTANLNVICEYQPAGVVFNQNGIVPPVCTSDSTCQKDGTGCFEVGQTVELRRMQKATPSAGLWEIAVTNV